jgi:hypothetical protein
MVAQNFNLIWEQNNRVLVFPVKLEKTIDDEWKGESNMVCNKCQSSVKQKYICESCGETSTIGQIKMRKDKDSGVFYTTEEYNQFIKGKVKQNIKVVSEIPLTDFLIPQNIELIDGNFFKIFAEEEYTSYIEKLREYLTLKGVGLMVMVGYYGKERAVVLIPTPLRLLGVFLRDIRLVRGNTAFTQQLADFSKDNSIDKFYEFIKLKLENKPIPMVEVVKEKPQIDLFFGEELEQLKTKEQIAVPIEVKSKKKE